MGNWAPRLFDFYVDYMSIFYQHNPHLHRPFLNSIWSSCTFNLGPHTCAIGHRDHANLAFGWCAITALGKPPHFVDCKLILEFPPGATILIPSAAIFHSNIPIADHEPAILSRNTLPRGFQSEEAYTATLTPAQIEEERLLGLKRAVEGVDCYSTLDELKSRVA
ncbi:hypothetical protein B0H12DRAFT_1201678 [Mycena haematopus]|nr:hypothetical protein B0H12DRAFT_1201678 [Mycena haematopus]